MGILILERLLCDRRWNRRDCAQTVRPLALRRAVQPVRLRRLPLLLLFCLHVHDLQLLRNEVGGARSTHNVSSRCERMKRATYRMRNIRMMTSPLLISFSERFSFLRSLIVPRLRWL